MPLSYTGGRTLVTIRDTLKNALDLTELVDDLNKTWQHNWADGTGANQQQIHFHDTVTLSSGASLVLDLNTAALAGGATHAHNGFGNCNFTKVKQIFIRVTTETAGYRLEVGGGSNPVPLFKDASDKAVVGAGGMLLISSPVDGVTVTAGTGDLLLIANPSAGAVTFDIFISGTGTVS